MRALVKIITKFTFLLFFLITLFISLVFIPHFIKSFKVVWVETSGIVLDSYVELKRTKRTVYCPEIKYKYQVNDREYINESTYATYGCKLTTSSAESIIKGYQDGKPVTVYYNDAENNESVLDPSIRWGDYLLAVTCVFLSLLSLYLLFSKRIMNIIHIAIEKRFNVT